MPAKNNPWAVTMIFKIQNTNPHYAPMDSVKVTDYSYLLVEDELDKMTEYCDAMQVITQISRKS
jgi:hypothetical protein